MREKPYTDAKFEVVHDPNPNWYPGRKELPKWFKTLVLTLAAIMFFLSRVNAGREMRAVEVGQQPEAAQSGHP